MAVDKFEISHDSTGLIKQTKFQWYWAPIFCSVWFALYYAAVIPSFFSFPDTLLMRDESLHTDKFIGERAQMQLLGLSSIGVKLVGSVENEVLAVNYLLKEIDKIKNEARTDLYDIEVDVQRATANFELWNMAVSYRNVTNIAVKIAAKEFKSESYLLLNSHFDSEVGSPGAADAGVMIVVMLETLRVLSISEQPLKNPVVFLLNGAEESHLLGSHGFITEHRWAKYCKALINLDSAGTGGREVLFQSGPNHPWLLKYYKKNVPHPRASTLAEELFQNDFVPSDTDFRVFRDYGNLPGMDLGHSYNGYQYHTKYDTFNNVERGTYQTTGENVLALTRALANASELEDPQAHAEGQAVFFDFLGWFMVYYSKTTGIITNIVSCIAAIVAIVVSVLLMTKSHNSGPPKYIWLRFLAICWVQVLTVLVSVALTILIAVIINALGLSHSWYTEQWLLFGLYFCPMFFVMGLLPALFIYWTKNTTRMPLNDTIACFMHGHCLILVFLCLFMTGFGIRTAFFTMIAIFFYSISTILNIITVLFAPKSYYLIMHLICQVLPFWFYTYQTFFFLNTFIPMKGRDGPADSPELFVAGVVAILTLHFAGFILPVLHKIRKSKIVFSVFGVLTIVFIIIAATPVGFPFKAETSPQRFYVLHTNRVIRGINGNVQRNESGFYIQPVNSRRDTLDDTALKTALADSWIHDACNTEVFCGLPLYNTRWMEWKAYARWIPAHPPKLPVVTKLQLVNAQFHSNTSVRLNFNLKSSDHVVIFIEPFSNITITNWSFNRTILGESYKPPYFVYNVDAIEHKELDFWLQMEGDAIDSESTYVRLGVGAHFQHHTLTYTNEYRDFLDSFPGWAYPTAWVASYDSWLF